MRPASIISYIIAPDTDMHDDDTYVETVVRSVGV